jgi:hypothetical protein
MNFIYNSFYGAFHYSKGIDETYMMFLRTQIKHFNNIKKNVFSSLKIRSANNASDKQTLFFCIFANERNILLNVCKISKLLFPAALRFFVNNHA